MSSRIKLKRGLKANLPLLQEAEPAFVTDDKELYVGDGLANHFIGGPEVYRPGSNGVKKLVCNDGSIQVTDNQGGVGTGEVIVSANSRFNLAVIIALGGRF